MSWVASDDWRVRYENENVFLIVNFDNGRSFELSVEVGKKQRTKPERSFSLAEVLRLRRVADAAAIDGMMVNEVSRLPNALAQLSVLTLQHASDFLAGNDLSFAQLAKMREKESDAYALERNLRTARARSEVAWLQRDYGTVIAVLAPMDKHLTPAERKRLEYSRKHLSP